MLDFTKYKSEPEPFKDLLAKFVFTRTYARYLPNEQRRETWWETVNRTVQYLHKFAPEITDLQLWDNIFLAIYHHEALPSGRLLWAAGDAADASHVTVYNCSFQACTTLEAFSETLYILMCGTGTGVSVKEEHVSQLPYIQFQDSTLPVETLKVQDSREGWATALLFGLSSWFSGGDIFFDYSDVRPAGAPLKTMGGRSSGPEPLKRLLTFTKEKVLSRQGKRLRSIDAADIINMIGEVVVVGGVRRSSEILLFSTDDPLMLQAKRGEYWRHSPYRRMGNNSLSFSEKPSSTEFMRLWLELAESGSGEPGLFIENNARVGAQRRLAHDCFGTNPCGEIVLRGTSTYGGGQFCNLSEVVVRSEDSEENIEHKVRIATIIGTIQSRMTNFPYLRAGWEANSREERLLGVSLTGQMDNYTCMSDGITLKHLREVAIETNKAYAKLFGIEPSAAITTVKPSGTFSQMVSSSSGLHTRWAPYYIRRVRISAMDPLLGFMREAGVPCEPESGEDPVTASTFVLSFPIKSPRSAITRKDLNALEQLKHWLRIKVNYTEHNPSCTIYVKSDEWITVAAWVYEHWDVVGGLSFLPTDDHVYPLAPYEEITKEQYEEMVKTFPTTIDFEMMREEHDQTTGAKDYACTGGACELP